MQLHDLLRDCFDEDRLRIFLSDEFDQDGRDVWDSTDGPWLGRVFDIATAMQQRGLVDRTLFETLVRCLPKRGDDIAATCRTTLGQPLSYAIGEPPANQTFPWADYRSAMSAGLVDLLHRAAYDARSRGFATISTSEIVRVYLMAQPWVALSVSAEAVGGDDVLGDDRSIDGREDPFDGTLGASYCVSKTVHGLAANTELPARYDEHDVFLDLARFGSGGSVRKLVPNGETMDRLNQASRRLGIGRVTRHAVLD